MKLSRNKAEIEIKPKIKLKLEYNITEIELKVIRKLRGQNFSEIPCKTEPLN